jgi:hypothetical protein
MLPKISLENQLNISIIFGIIFGIIPVFFGSLFTYALGIPLRSIT